MYKQAALASPSSSSAGTSAAHAAASINIGPLSTMQEEQSKAIAALQRDVAQLIDQLSPLLKASAEQQGKRARQ